MALMLILVFITLYVFLHSVQAGTQKPAVVQSSRSCRAQATQLVEARRIAAEHAVEQQARAERQACAVANRHAQADPQVPTYARL